MPDIGEHHRQGDLCFSTSNTNATDIKNNKDDRINKLSLA